MKKPRTFLLLLCLVFLPFIAGCWLGPPYADWTFLVYLAADNNLDPCAVADLEEMMAVGSTSRLKIVVQYDPLSPEVPTRRYRVARGRLVELARLAETNTG
ncbi:MAG: hypothetical protein GX493_02245, partial [Firmicutes bacterium]|nr:hypothetical protein [Bacillota bacterium]